MNNFNILIAIIIISVATFIFVMRPKEESNIVPNSGVIDNSKTVLNLSGQGLQQLPQTVFDMTNLEMLDISNNNLTGALPSQIGNLKKLKIINVSNNQMTGIPAEIGQLTMLEELNYANNKITGLPMEIANLKNLKIFNLTGNEYSKLDLAGIKNILPNLQVVGE